MTMIGDRAAFSIYRGELSGHAALSAEAERELAERYRAGDRDAGQKLVGACLPFVVTIALEYRRWGLPLEDLVQEGNIGLLKAAERFDPDRGCRLATYAAYWIRAEIREYVARGYRIVRLGSSKSERRALRIYRKTHERDPGVLAELSGLTEERATELLPLLMARDVSLERTPGDDGRSPADKLASDDVSPEDQVVARDEATQLHRVLRKVVAELSPRERRIVKQRWLTDEPKTLEQLGEAFGVSKERVRQLEERAKKRMRARLEELTAEPVARSA
ncbi:MAG TPA: sigma-70 family RNA polymerase sigma factor [Minicystis sp.]|nr:sigma-70 family RNA polymerase sigma factor [Minicystis sp.]